MATVSYRNQKLYLMLVNTYFNFEKFTHRIMKKI